MRAADGRKYVESRHTPLLSATIACQRCHCFIGAKFDRFRLLYIVPLLRGGANYLRKSFVEGIIVATFDAQILKYNIKL